MKDLNFEGKTALIRVDFNVPLDEQHRVIDNTRIRRSLPTIHYVLEHGGAVVLMAHLGRPQKKKLADGSINVKKYTLNHLVEPLSQLLHRRVEFIGDSKGPAVEQRVKKMSSGDVLLIENTRFYAEEKAGDEAYAESLASLGDIYINDAFGAAHRAHASTTVVARYFSPESKTLGLLMKDEIDNARAVLEAPKRPLTAILGGAKVSDKINLIDKLIDFADHILIGGGMAFTFIKALGGSIGQSLCEDDKIDDAMRILSRAQETSCEIFLPLDVVAASNFSQDAESVVCSIDRIPEGWMGLDIGPKTVDLFHSVILKSLSVVWNGPMGVFEMEQFAKGTQKIAASLSSVTSNGVYTLVGGGDSVAAITQLGLQDKVSFVSTGGGAMLAFLEGKELPGIAAILESTPTSIPSK